MKDKLLKLPLHLFLSLLVLALFSLGFAIVNPVAGLWVVISASLLNVVVYFVNKWAGSV